MSLLWRLPLYTDYKWGMNTVLSMNAWTSHAGTMFGKTTAPSAGYPLNLTSARPLPYANIWTGYTPLIPEQLCSFIHTSEMKCLAPAGWMTPALLWRLPDHCQHSAAIWKHASAQLSQTTEDKGKAGHGTLNALKWVCFLFTYTFELDCSILHGFRSTCMTSFPLNVYFLLYKATSIIQFNKCMKRNVNIHSGCMLYDVS